MSNDSIERLCHHCGKTFSAFLHEMAEQNAKVVCPSCRGSRDGNPPKATKPGPGARPIKKTI